MKTLKPRQLDNGFTERSGPPHEEIARRAYQLWEERGKLHGCHEEDWDRAESELNHQSDGPGGTPGATKETPE